MILVQGRGSRRRRVVLLQLVLESGYRGYDRGRAQGILRCAAAAVVVTTVHDLLSPLLFRRNFVVLRLFLDARARGFRRLLAHDPRRHF